MDSYLAQNIVVEATTNRGYHNGWTDAQFAARNIAKLGEELAELAEHFNLPSGVAEMFEHFGEACRLDFDDKAIWDDCGPKEGHEAEQRKEAADCQVVLFNIADALQECHDTTFDVVRAAVRKAEADEKRGVR